MYLAQIKFTDDSIESPIDGARLEGLITNGKSFSPSDDLLELSNLYKNVSVIKCEGRIIYGKVEDENGNETPISIEAAGDIMSSCSRGRVKLKTSTIVDNDNISHEVIAIDENTLIIPEPDDDDDDDYGIFYFISRLD